MLESFINTLFGLLLLLGLPALFVVFFLKGAIVGKPIPATVILPGYILAISGSLLETAGIVMTTVIASTLGQLFVYFGARRRGVSFIESAPRVSISDAKLRQGEALFEKHGGAGIFFTNLVPYLRGLILIPAGIAEYPVGRVVLYAFVSTLLYHSAVVILVIGVVRILF